MGLYGKLWEIMEIFDISMAIDGSTSKNQGIKPTMMIHNGDRTG